MKSTVYIKTTIPSFNYEIRTDAEFVAMRDWTSTGWLLIARRVCFKSAIVDTSRPSLIFRNFCAGQLISQIELIRADVKCHSQTVSIFIKAGRKRLINYSLPPGEI